MSVAEMPAVKTSTAEVMAALNVMTAGMAPPPVTAGMAPAADATGCQGGRGQWPGGSTCGSSALLGSYAWPSGTSWSGDWAWLGGTLWIGDWAVTVFSDSRIQD